MNAFVELAKAIAMPIAITVGSICILAGIVVVAHRRPQFHFKLGNWLEFGSEAKAVEVLPIRDASEIGALAPVDEPPPRPGVELQGATGDGPSIERALSGQEQSVFATKDPSKFPAAFEQFKKEGLAYKEDPEFWDSWYVKRLCEISDADSLSELNRLSQANPSWSWPLIYIARRCAILGDIDAAAGALDQALGRNSEKKDRVLAEYIKFLSKYRSRRDAFEFARGQLLAGLTDAQSGAILGELCSISHKDGDVFSDAILREMYVRYKQNDMESQFRLAFSYGEVEEFRSFSFSVYSSILFEDDNHAAALNNVGVIYSKEGQNVAMSDFFERSLKIGNAMAAANIAKELIRIGMLDRAQDVLDQATNMEGGESIVVSAKEELSETRQRGNASAAEVRDRIEDEALKYVISVKDSYNYWKASGQLVPVGSFLTESGDTLELGEDVAACKLMIDGVEYRGDLQAKTCCFEGMLYEYNKSLLSARSVRTLILAGKQGNIRVLVWPARGASKRLVIIEGTEAAAGTTTAQSP